MAAPLTVVKVGGSLYDLPDLRSRLSHWLSEQTDGRYLLVPGGGATADVARRFDALHSLGEEVAHWLALRGLAVNAAFLGELLQGKPVVEHPRDTPPGVAILDPFAFAVLDERQSPARCLPHTWAATSDAVAARAAVVGGADRLVLLKSVTLPQGMEWAEAGRRGFVDPVFVGVIHEVPRLAVQVVNLRVWNASACY
jgi:aspartokinase-like uncharacterized kinase